MSSIPGFNSLILYTAFFFMTGFSSRLVCGWKVELSGSNYAFGFKGDPKVSRSGNG